MKKRVVIFLTVGALALPNCQKTSLDKTALDQQAIVDDAPYDSHAWVLLYRVMDVME